VSFQPPKGTDDIAPPQSEPWRRLLRDFDALASRYGYGLIITPVFESTDLFERGVGEDTEVVQKQMYTFTDRGGRSITLRPENTAGVMRAYLAGGGAGISKVAYSGPMFRYERPQAGRRRQFWQVGVEYLGTESPIADVETIVLARDFLGAAETPTELVLNSLGDGVCRPAYLSLLNRYLETKRGALCDDSLARLPSNPLRVLDCKVCAPLLVDAPLMADHLCAPCVQHYEAVKNALTGLGIDYRQDSRLVRGLDYYVRTAFEFVSTTLTTAQTALLGGGRYDGLAEVIGGKGAPGVGWAAGVDRILLASKMTAAPPLDAYVVVEAGRSPLDALRLAGRLRDAGLSADFEPEGRSVKSQFRSAERRGARSTVILSERGAQVRIDGDKADLAAEEVATWLSIRLQG